MLPSSPAVRTLALVLSLDQMVPRSSLSSKFLTNSTSVIASAISCVGRATAPNMTLGYLDMKYKSARLLTFFYTIMTLVIPELP